jgi:peptide deformylase
MILKLVPEHSDVLHQPAERFDFDNPPMDPTELFENLKETMIANGGLGLSAPQVGIPYQVFVMGNPRDPDSIFSVFNPKVVSEEGEAVSEEGCLTYPGLFIKIKRSHEIRARFSGHDGYVDTMPINGYSAMIFQHEYDHLQGITFNKRCSKLQLDRAKKQKQKLDRKRKKNVV